MLHSEQIYTAENCTPAYQLRWSLSLFTKKPIPPSEEWLEKVQKGAESDGVRILEVTPFDSGVWSFLLSTQPHVAPARIVRAIKGRLDGAVRKVAPKKRRNCRQLRHGRYQAKNQE